MLSTLHQAVNIGTDNKKKPETVKFYNATKYGVDVVDSMAREYSVKASSRRWPVHVFYNILDMAAINDCVLYREITGCEISRRKFLMKLCDELRQAYVEKRQIPSPSLQLSDGTPCTPCIVSGKRKQGQIGKCKKNKSSELCAVCKKIVCGKCIGHIVKC